MTSRLLIVLGLLVGLAAVGCDTGKSDQPTPAANTPSNLPPPQKAAGGDKNNPQGGAAQPKPSTQ